LKTQVVNLETLVVGIGLTQVVLNNIHPVLLSL